jgi:hypothetical protein
LESQEARDSRKAVERKLQRAEAAVRRSERKEEERIKPRKEDVS